MKRLLVIAALAFGLALAGCPNSKAPEKRKSKKSWKVDKSKRRTAKKRHASPPRDGGVKVNHEKHPHGHGAHPHDSSDHHHHTHPHPHLAGQGGHHHPY